MKHKGLVTVIVPTLDEEAGIRPTLESLDAKAFAARGWDLEILVVDGESKDRTREEATACGARVIVEPRRGYGRAYKTGLREARGDIVITGDADGTYPFDEAHLFVDLLLDGDYDFLTCDRYADLVPGAMSRTHRLGNWVLSLTARLLFWVRLRDSQSGMWVIRRTALERLPIDELPDSMAFSQELKIEAVKRKDVRSREVPGRLKPRLGDAKLESWTDGVSNLLALVRKRFTTRW